MKKNLAKKIIGFVLSFMILFGSIPMQVYADFSYSDYSHGNPVEVSGSYEIEGTLYDVSVLTCITPNAGEVVKIDEGDEPNDYLTFGYEMNDGWKFVGWTSYYYGGSVKAENEIYGSDNKYYFSKANSAYDVYRYFDSSIRYNKASGTNGTAVVYAIFKPSITVNHNEGIKVTGTGTESFDPEKQTELYKESSNFPSGAKFYYDYGTNVKIAYEITDSKYVLNNVSVTGSSIYNPTGYHDIDEQILTFNNIKGPLKIDITTRLKQQKVSFDANGGSGTMATQTFNSDEEKTLTANSFTMDNYKFIGWNTKSDGSGTSYTDEQSVSFNPANDGDNITLYAQWERLPNAICTAPTANDLTYNNEEQELITKGTSNQGVLMYSLEENGTYKENIPTAKKADKYTVWYYVKGDNNHNDSDKASVEVEIKKANPDIGTVSANIINDTTDIASVVLNRTDENIAGSFVIEENQSLNLGENIINYEFIPNDTLNYNVINGQVSVTVKDTISPTGTVTFTDTETVWDDIPGTITFEMYFKNEQKVIVAAADSFSGVDKIEYYETNEILDLEGVKLITEEEWDLVEGDINIPVEDGKQFIYYIRITDKSGNIGYIATNGAEFDTTAPVITGVYNSKTYYTSQKVTVTDKNLDTVTLNGEIVTDTIILEGNKEATYTIVATDKVGNSTKVTVKMKMLDELIDVNVEDVTPEDKLKLENAKSELEKNLEENSDIYSEEEKKAIEDKIKAIEEALNAIKNIKEEIIENTEEETIEDTDNINNPTTGDNIEKYFTMFIVSILGISAIILRKKKKTK